MPKDDKPKDYIPFLTWEQCNEIAERVWGLIKTYDALPRFREQLKQWAAHCEGVQKKRDEWQERRTEHEQRIYRDPRLQDAERRGPPGGDENWFFGSFALRDESCRAFKATHKPFVGDMRSPFVGVPRGWFPDEFNYDNAPPEPRPLLPVPKGPVALFEMYVGLSAICDDDYGEERELEDGNSTRSDEKINQWVYDDPLDDDSAVELMIREAAATFWFGSLMRCVRQLPKTNRKKLNGWVEKIEADLKEWAPRRAGPQAGGDGAREAGEEQQAPGGAALEDGLTPADSGSDNDDKEPDDLMYLKVVKSKYRVSQRQLDRDIKSGKLECWRDDGGKLRRVSDAAAKKLYPAL